MNIPKNLILENSWILDGKEHLVPCHAFNNRMGEFCLILQRRVDVGAEVTHFFAKQHLDSLKHHACWHNHVQDMILYICIRHHQAFKFGALPDLSGCLLWRWRSQSWIFEEVARCRLRLARSVPPNGARKRAMRRWALRQRLERRPPVKFRTLEEDEVYPS